MCRHEYGIVDRYRLRAGALQATNVPAIVVDNHVADGNETPGKRWRCVLSGNQNRQNEPGGTVDAARPRPTPRNLDAAVDHLDLGTGRVGDGEEIFGIVPDFLLSLQRTKNDVIQPKHTANVPHHPVLPQARPSSNPTSAISAGPYS